MSRTTIREATLRDLDALRDVYRRSSLSNEGDRAPLLAHPEALELPESGIAEGRTRVAVEDGRIVGFATIEVTGAVAELEDLFVDPDRMRRGIGRLLIADVRRLAAARGVARIEVDANPHARAFYERAGFVLDGTVDTDFGSALRMHLEV
jgi:GNAT superfamily N-acetyltransferase